MVESTHPHPLLTQKLSLVSKPFDFIQPDLNGDGARDLDPIGNLGNVKLIVSIILYGTYILKITILQREAQKKNPL